MYQVTRTLIKENDPLYEYCVFQTESAKCLYNAALFFSRNHYTACGKVKDGTTLFENERYVEEIIAACCKKPGRILTQYDLEKIMRFINSPDYFRRGFAAQTAQQVLIDAADAFKGWKESLKEFDEHPEKFSGKPKMPHYTKSCMRTVAMTNQDCVVYGDGIKFPKTKVRMPLPDIPEGGRLKEISIKPYYGCFLVLCSFEVEDVTPRTDLPYICGIDFGVNNIAAIVTDEGSALLYQGGALKAENQLFNKERARLQPCLPEGIYTSKRLVRLSLRRDCFLHDQLHKISRSIINFCLARGIGTIVLGVNDGWKQNVNLGKQNNQSFVQMPISRLRFMITYKAQSAGIRVVIQEESYTSRADFLSNDPIPTYKVNDDAIRGNRSAQNAFFSGRRIKRGIYVSRDGTVLNADINAAANIMRKAGFDAFPDDVSYLKNPKVIGFRAVNKSIPAKRIAAA